MDFKDKSVAVIGGTSGIGRAAAQLFIAQGAHVVVTGRSAQSADAAARSLGHASRGVALELTEPGGFEPAAAQTGEIDSLVMTAGETYFMPTQHDRFEGFSRTITANLSGSYFALLAFAKRLRPGGSIVLCTTVLSKDYFFGATALAASRAGLAVALRALAVELAPRGIRVNAVAVGPIETPAWDKAGASAEDRQAVQARVPLARLGRSEEVAEAIMFLASIRASFITGHELAVDGGWTAA